MADWDECVRYAELTDVGMRRASNQDSCVVRLASSDEVFDERGHLFVVADGMGAHAAGELASQMAVEAIPLYYYKTPGKEAPEVLQGAITDANAKIFTKGEAIPDFKKMGTTCSSLVLTSRGALIGHVGDSRIYRFRKNKLEQLSFDHSLVWELEAESKRTGKVASLENVPKNVITRSLGPHEEVKVDLEGYFPIQSEDIFLLCSDGLTGEVSDNKIATILSCMPDIQVAAQTLINLANLNGGSDNVTLILVEVLPQMIVKLKEFKSKQGSSVEKKKSESKAFFSKLFGFLAKKSGTKKEAALKRLGRGPYRVYDAKPPSSFVDSLHDIIAQLKSTAERRGWTIDTETLKKKLNQARLAGQEENHKEQVRELLMAINYLMAQLKQGKKE